MYMYTYTLVTYRCDIEQFLKIETLISSNESR